MQDSVDKDIAKLKEQNTLLNLANTLLIERIAERERVSNPLNDNEQRFRLLAENSTDIISQQTVDNVYLYVSPACKTVLGYTSREMTGKNIYRYIHESDVDKVKRQNSLLREHNQTNTLTYRVRCKDGSFRWFETTNRLIADTRIVKTAEIHSTSRDITERIQEEKARLRSQKLAQVYRLNTMEEMASGMAHEINQPLAAIVNYIQGCLRYLEDEADEKNKKVMDVMEKASEQAKRAGEIIHRLKNFFSKGKLYRAPIRVTRLTKEAVNFIKDDLSKNKVFLRYKFGKQLPSVYVDKIQIQQVILNLVQNAIEAMIDTPYEDRYIVIAASQVDDKFIQMSCIDAGPQFPENFLDKIFQPFFTTKPKGTGMGLPISRSIIEAHGGKFSILNGPEKGVQCTLPIVQKKRS